MVKRLNSDDSDLSPSEKRKKEEEYQKYLEREVEYDYGQTIKGIRGGMMFADQHLDSQVMNLVADSDDRSKTGNSWN